MNYQQLRHLRFQLYNEFEANKITISFLKRNLDRRVQRNKEIKKILKQKRFKKINGSNIKTR